MDGMTTGTSTLGSVTSAEMEMAADWSSFLDANGGFNPSALTDGSNFPQIWRKDVDLPSIEDDQFLSIDPSMSLGNDTDPFSLIRDPLALYSETMDADYGTS